jgi:xylulokinase
VDELLLGIDIGTGSSKAVLTTPDGVITAKHAVAHGMDVPHPGFAEQDADDVWWGDLVRICKHFEAERPGILKRVSGVAVSAIGPCLLPLDRHGTPLRPGILYGVDTRASREISVLNDVIPEQEQLMFSRMTFTSQAIGPKILWLKRHEPEVWSKTATLTTASAFLTFKLTGRHVMDRHTASHYMPLINMDRLEWDDRHAHHVAPISMLPELGWSDDVAGHVTSEAQRDTGLPEGIPVAVGAVDALSEAISVGVTQPGELMVMYGSTTFFILNLEQPIPDPRVWMTAAAFKPNYALAAGMSTTGSLTRWIRDSFAKELDEEHAYAQLFDEAARVPSGSEGLLLLPFFSGERTPINDPKARGVIAGLNLTHTRAHVFRAALEGVAHGIRHNIDTFEQLGATVHRIVAVGGGVQGGLWPQIVSDVTGRAQDVPAETIGASYGDAFLAGLAADLVNRDDLAKWTAQSKTLEPNAAAHRRFSDDHQLYLDLYNDTRSTVHKLVDRV